MARENRQETQATRRYPHAACLHRAVLIQKSRKAGSKRRPGKEAECSRLTLNTGLMAATSQMSDEGEDRDVR